LTTLADRRIDLISFVAFPSKVLRKTFRIGKHLLSRSLPDKNAAPFTGKSIASV
jgi:hypothetical protein